jgi:hypothetical protein
MGWLSPQVDEIQTRRFGDPGSSAMQASPLHIDYDAREGKAGIAAEPSEAKSSGAMVHQCYR